MFKGLILEKKVCNMRYAPESSEKVETELKQVFGKTNSPYFASTQCVNVLQLEQGQDLRSRKYRNQSIFG